LKSYYVVDGSGKYLRTSDAWDNHYDNLIRIFHSIEWEPALGKSTYVDEAKALIEKLLKEQPDNAGAWNVYFTNYYRFSFAGGPIGFGTHPYVAWAVPYYPDEIEQIKKAVALCPNDPTLKLWCELITGPQLHDSTLPFLVSLNQQLNDRGFLGNDFPKIDYESRY